MRFAAKLFFYEYGRDLFLDTLVKIDYIFSNFYEGEKWFRRRKANFLASPIHTQDGRDSKRTAYFFSLKVCSGPDRGEVCEFKNYFCNSSR